ncbi:MAG: HNH endonuclease [Microbacteriaceae bacterium]|nr:HNH endonuclease [Microbacteriaceae bacterium]
MRVFVGNTDKNWITQLSAKGELDQVNFWYPSAEQGFSALNHGDLFLFKSKADFGNQIVGAGIFDVFVRARVRDAWDWFGEANGTQSLESLLSRLRQYRKISDHLPYETEIGCVLLRTVEFFSPDKYLPAPEDWSPNIVRGRGYDTDQLSADHPVVRAVGQYLRTGEGLPEDLPEHIRAQMFGDAKLVVPRLGQAAFKAVIANNYGYHCAITGDKVRPVLEAAHILPVAAGGVHRPDNGLLLRSDMHTLFDRGYIAVDPKLRLAVSPRLREEFGNGDALYAKAGTEIARPERRADRPNPEFLEWHMETLFKKTA